MIRYSIVASYYNRRQQLINTLNTIKRSSKVGEIEFIVVDDCSADIHNIDDLPTLYDFPIKVIHMDKNNRWYINPCVPFNVGFKEAAGAVVIIQNPECLHVGDIIADIDNNIKDNNYLIYGCYSIDQSILNKITNLNFNSEDIFNNIKTLISPTAEHNKVMPGQACWYSHSKYRPAGYHFCSVITKANLDDLGGFDERYALGISYDDDEFVERIKRKGLELKFIDEPFSIHQWHYSENNFFAKAIDPNQALIRNEYLLNNITKKEKSCKANL